jgi:aryl carrier-like protein
MCRHPQVADAVVTVHERAPGDRRLVAYLVPQPRTRPNLTDLRRFLARELPPYLVPAAFAQLDKLPLTANGKIDYSRLPAPTDERPDADEELVLPSTPLQRELADIVAAILGVTLVGANDNFFELGGDSILAIQVAARAQEKGIPLAPLDLFQHPTVALLAEATAKAATAADGERAGNPGATGNGRAPGDAGSAGRQDPAPSDFPLARVDQGDLDTLVRQITGQQA